MKKSNIKHYALASALAFGAHTAHADFIGIYAGAGVWQTGFSGDVGAGEESATLEELGFEDTQSNFMFVAFEHPVPVLPNIRVATADVSSTGSATMDREFSLTEGNATIPVSSETNSDLDLSYIDATLYWEVLDNWVSLDIGFTARSIDGSAQVTWQEPASTEEETQNAEFSAVLPMAYGKAQFDLPFSGFYVGASGNIISYSGSSISDMEAKVGYMTDGLGLDFGVELGYRSFALTIDEDEDLKTDMSVDGIFGSVIVHF